MFHAGSSFFIPNDRHLWFVLSDPEIDPQSVVYVNLTSYSPPPAPQNARNDPACIWTLGDHPFVEHPTCVYYHGAHIGSIANLRGRYACGGISFHEPASPQMLAKMQSSSADSHYTGEDVYQLLVDQGLAT